MSRKHLSLIPGMFGEVEMLAMTPDDLGDLQGILDADLADSILNFISEVENADDSIRSLGIYSDLVNFKDSVTRMLYDTCYRLTFHKRVKEKEIISFIAKLDMKLAIDTIQEEINIEQIRDNLNWLFDNKMYWKTMTEKRSRDSFMIFRDMCARVQARTSSLYDRLNIIYKEDEIEKPINIKYVLKVNKECFYSPHEKPQRTGMGILNDVTLEKINLFLKGLDYYDLCQSQGINLNRREFAV